MKSPRLLMVLTIANLALLTFLLLGQVRHAVAASPAPVLRGSMLEIVDDQGRVRASIKLHAASRGPDGKAYPETVMFRLIDAAGRPEVKLGASEDGGGIGFVGATDQTHVILEAQGTAVQLKLTNGNGQEHLVTPNP